MYKINNIKAVIKSAIKNIKLKETNIYNDKFNQLSNMENFADIYYISNATLGYNYKNFREQRETAAKILQLYLTNDFFKDATIVTKTNGIVFLSDDFEVEFPTHMQPHMQQQITIKYKNAVRFPHYYGGVSPFAEELADLMEKYFNKKSFNNFKALADLYGKNYRKHIFATILKYINTYKECNKNELDRIRKIQEQHKVKLKEMEQKEREYKDKQIYAKKFVNSLTDLQIFKDAGWGIRYVGIEDESGKIIYD